MAKKFDRRLILPEDLALGQALAAYDFYYRTMAEAYPANEVSAVYDDVAADYEEDAARNRESAAVEEAAGKKHEAAREEEAATAHYRMQAHLEACARRLSSYAQDYRRKASWLRLQASLEATIDTPGGYGTADRPNRKERRAMKAEERRREGKTE